VRPITLRDTGAEINYKRCTRKYTYLYTYIIRTRCIYIKYYTFVSVRFCHARQRIRILEEKKDIKLKTISIQQDLATREVRIMEVPILHIIII